MWAVGWDHTHPSSLQPIQPAPPCTQARQLNAFERLLARTSDGPPHDATDEWSSSFAPGGQYRGAPPLRPTFGSELRERTAAAAVDARERAGAALSSARERINDRVADRAPQVESAKGSLRSLGGRAAGLSGRAADSLRSLPSRGLSAVVGAPSAPTTARLAGEVFPSRGAPSAPAPALVEEEREQRHAPALEHYAAAQRAQATACAAPATVPLAARLSEPQGRCAGRGEGARLQAATPVVATGDLLSLMGSSRDLLGSGLGEGRGEGAAHGTARLLEELGEPAVVSDCSTISSPKLMMPTPVAASRSCSASCWDGSPVLIPPTPSSAPPVPPSARASHLPAAAESPRSFDQGLDLEALFASAAAPAAPAAPAALAALAAPTADPSSFGLMPWGCASSTEAAAGSTHPIFGAALEPWPQAAPQLAFPEGEAFASPSSTNLLD